MQIEISGIPITVEKKNIKNMHLYVKPPKGNVMVSAPITLSDKSIEMFVRTKIGWIKKQREKFDKQERQSERRYVSGESIYLWGKQYYLRVIHEGRANSMTIEGEIAVLNVRRDSTIRQRETFVNEWYRFILKEKIEQLLPKWINKTGLEPSSWQTKYMTTKWGTCNTEKRKIWINLQLAKKPVECLEYVILHELAHLKVRNHGAAFVAILDEYMPYWRDVRKQLNESKLDYMEEKSFVED